MGAWGVSLYQSDDGCNVRDFFLSTLQESPNRKYKAFEVTEKHYSDQMECTNVVLSLANLAITFTSLSPELHEKAIEAIDSDLEAIERWKEPEKRKAFLMAFKEFLNVCVSDS